MEKSESIKNLAIALCKFQGTVEKIVKTATNPFFKSKYASLADILDVIREPLQLNGLSFVQFPEGESGLTTMLMHESGEHMTATYIMKPVKNDPQGQGSAITYQRRYALGAILGLNIDDDDDGNGASKQPTPQKQTVPPKPKENIILITDSQKKELDIITNNPFINQAESDYINLWKLAGTEPAIKKFIDGIKPLLAKRENEKLSQ